MVTRVNRLSRYTGILILLIGESFAPVGVFAQEAIVPFQLSFSDPGARSMGFGGAFVALADDATAAFSNPAGLVQLLKPEISVEVRNWSYSTHYREGGRAEGLPSGVGIDTMAGLRTATSEYDDTGLSYLSLAYPRDNWSLALYRHKYANLKFSAETQGFFGGGSTCCQERWYDQKMTSDIDIVSYGLSAAYRLNDKFNIGLGVIYYDASFYSRATEFMWDEDTTDSFFAPNSFLPERSVITEEISAEDSDWALTGGFLWTLSESWSIGGVYRQKMEIDLKLDVTAGEAVDFGVPPGGVILAVPAIPVQFPDFYGLGFAYRKPDGRFTLSFQWDRVEYSDIPDSLRLDELTIDDIDELHLGAEYVFLGSTPIIALRLGAWLEPDHQMRATIDDPFVQALLPRGDDEIHYSAGLGIATQRFQIDLAADFADRTDTVSLSAIYNF
jgi:hypothetical protein